jgi:hypothetical protein
MGGVSRDELQATGFSMKFPDFIEPNPEIGV